MHSHRVMQHLFLLVALLSNPVPAGTLVKDIARFAPRSYQANRSNASLPKVGSLSTKQRQNFTGIIWVRELAPPAEFNNGKRVNRKAGQTVEAFLKTQRNPNELRYSTKALTGFMVNLPGDESKLKGFEGALYTPKLVITIKGGKVVSSHSSNHK